MKIFFDHPQHKITEEDFSKPIKAILIEYEMNRSGYVNGYSKAEEIVEDYLESIKKQK